MIDEKFEQLEEKREEEGSIDLPTIDLTDLGIDPVCDYAHIWNTYNGLRAGIFPGSFDDWSFESP